MPLMTDRARARPAAAPGARLAVATGLRIRSQIIDDSPVRSPVSEGPPSSRSPLLSPALRAPHLGSRALARGHATAHTYTWGRDNASSRTHMCAHTWAQNDPRVRRARPSRAIQGGHSGAAAAAPCGAQRPPASAARGGCNDQCVLYSLTRRSAPPRTRRARCAPPLLSSLAGRRAASRV